MLCKNFTKLILEFAVLAANAANKMNENGDSPTNV